MSAAVSIIVPCYNVAPYLDKCMESLTLQTLGDLEIISVNDGSGDDTPAILRAWAERDGRIRVVDRENGGLSAARNTGMALAGGNISALWTRMITWNTPCMAACWKKPAGVMRM